MKTTKVTFGAWLVIATFAGFMDRASGGPIPISGTAAIQNAVSDTFNFAGPGLTASSGTPDDPGIVIATCQQGSVCDLTLVVQACCGQFFFLGEDSSGSLNGVSANDLGGSLTFSGSDLIPIDTSGSVQLMNIPITVTGVITGYNFQGQALGPALWSVAVSGTGTLEITGVDGGGVDYFKDASWAFTGTATPVPEPASLLLVGTAILAFARRRRG